MRSQIVLITIILLLLQGCLEQAKDGGNKLQPVEVIDLTEVGNIRDLTLSDIAYSFELISLETNEANLLTGRPLKIIHNHGQFFIDSKSIIYRFSEEGKFLNSIGSVGRGPEEYTSMLDYDVSEDGKLTIILSPRKVMIYNDIGEMITSFEVESGTQKVATYENTIITYKDNFTKTGNFSFCFYEISGKQIKCQPSLYHTPEVVNTGTWFQNSVLFYKSRGKLFAKELHSDTIFAISGTELNPHIILSSGSHRYTPEARASGLSNPNLIIVYEVREIDNYLKVGYSFMGKGILLYHNTLTSENTVINESNGIMDDKISGGNIYTLFNSNYESSFFYMISAIKYLKYKQLAPETDDDIVDKTRNVEETSNPVIVKFRLKEL
jgi:hypothetical protein